MVVGMTDAGNCHPYQNLAMTKRIEINVADLPVVPNSAQHCGLALHRSRLPCGVTPNRRTPRAAAARITPIANLNRRRDTGYHSSSFDCVGIRGAVIACSRQYLRMPAAPPSRLPTPECFQPPIG